MTRNEEARQIATRAYNVAVDIINESPDLGIALAAMAQVSRWMQAESESWLTTNNKTLANIVFDDKEQ